MKRLSEDIDQFKNMSIFSLNEAYGVTRNNSALKYNFLQNHRNINSLQNSAANGVKRIVLQNNDLSKANNIQCLESRINSICIYEMLRKHLVKLKNFCPDFMNKYYNKQYLLIAANHLPNTLSTYNENVFYQYFFPNAIQKLHNMFKSSTSCRLVTLIYFERLLSNSSYLIVPQNILPLLYGVIFAIATKFIDDSQYCNWYYSKCLGVDLQLFNYIERNVLNSLFYRLFVDEVSYKFISNIIMSFFNPKNSIPLEKVTSNRVLNHSS